MAALWAELLKVDKVGRHDNFFELGGHSLLAMTLIERMQQDGLACDVRALFGTPTIAGLAGGVCVAAGGSARKSDHCGHATDYSRNATTGHAEPGAD